MTGSPVNGSTKTVECKLKELQARGLERLRQGAVFWPYSWRAELCTCTSCKVGPHILAPKTHKSWYAAYCSWFWMFVPVCRISSEGLCCCWGAVSLGPVWYYFGIWEERLGRALWAAPPNGIDKLDGPCTAAGGHLRWGRGGTVFLLGCNCVK